MSGRRGLVLALCILAGLTSSCSVQSFSSAPCRSEDDQSVMILIAQSVPSATRLPCIATLPAGWTYAGYTVRSGKASLTLENAIAGAGSVEVTLTAACDTTGAVEVPVAADEKGLQRFEEPRSITGGLGGNRYYVFRGGCITYAYTFASGAPPGLTSEADSAISFVARSEIVERTKDELGVDLCGAGSPPCPGGT